ncbi:MAG: DUF4838 domain-containing protein [Candidatus Hydrogenedentes bacterium]|nr:DUF4838 domain-containing protein [Candidatus Hydrogenedentota bacterium]
MDATMTGNSRRTPSAWRHGSLVLALVLVAGAVVSPFAAGAGPVERIVIDDPAPATVSFAANELQKYFQQLGGVRLPIDKASAAKSANAIRLRVAPDETGPKRNADGFRLKTQDATLYVEGESGCAVLMGVYDLLERMGCRWLGPGLDFVPTAQSLELPSLDVTEAPALRWRGLELISGSTPAIVDWMVKSKLNVAWPETYIPNTDLTASEKSMQHAAVPDMIARGMTVFWGGHILPVLMPATKYADHPEYFASIKGKRLNPDVSAQDRNQLCVSNAETLRVLTENTVTFLRNHTWIDVLFLWAGDTTEWCSCDACRAMLPAPDKTSAFGGLDRAALYTRMVKAVSEGVAKALPGRRIAFNHYYNLEELPRDASGKADTSVLPGRGVLSAVDDYHQCDRHPFTDATCPSGKRIEPIAAMWGPLYDDSVSWSYYFAWNFTKGLPVSEVSKIFEDSRFVRRLGVNGVVDNVSLEPGSLHWLNNLPNFYAYAKAAWNPDRPPDEVLSDFVTHWYGPSAKPMLEVWRGLETATRKYGLDPEYMPSDQALAAPAVVHGRMVDAPLPPNSGPGADIRLLIPNETVARRLLALLDEAQSLAGERAPYAIRVKAVSALVRAWDTEADSPAVFGFLNNGAQFREALYERVESNTVCTLIGGNNRGDAFRVAPVDAEQLAVPGDFVESRVSIRVGTGETGSPLYRAGPGLYQADNAKSVCGAQNTHTATFFISNLDSHTSGPRRVIVMAHDGAYSTDLKSSVDNAWEYGREVTLRIRYVRGDASGHTYEYAYDAGSGWTVVTTTTTATKMPIVSSATSFSFLEPSAVKYPIVNWARVSDPTRGHSE